MKDTETTSRRLLIGIDPNYSEKKETRIGISYGFAGSGELSFVGTMTVGELYDFFDSAAGSVGSIVRIETPSPALHKASYEAEAAYMRTKGGHVAKLRSVGGIIARRGVNIGALRMQSLMVADYAKRVGLEVEAVAETRRRRLDKGDLSKFSGEALKKIFPGGLALLRTYWSKIDAKRFGVLTGWKKRSSEDARDAALLILPEVFNTKKRN